MIQPWSSSVMPAAAASKTRILRLVRHALVVAVFSLGNAGAFADEQSQGITQRTVLSAL